MRICVLGASGFLGRSLCPRLKAAGHEITQLDSKNCDLRQQTSLNKYSDLKYDQIYHLAAWTQAGDFCLGHSGEQWIINQQINTNTLAWWQRYQPQAKLVFMGSSCVYDPGLDLIEDNFLLGTPIESLFTYAMTKRMLYVGACALQKQWGMTYLCFVPSTLYGPGYHTDGRQMHFIFDLIRKIILGKLCNAPVVLWGDGYQRRELVYVDDFVDVMLRLSATQKNEVINVGAGEESTIRHFASLICDQVGFNFNAIEFDISRYVGAKSKCLDVCKMKRLLPDLTMTPLDRGLRKTIEWVESNLETMPTDEPRSSTH